jgi:glutathione synthase
MKIGIVVNDVDTEMATAATTVIARAAVARKHEVHMIGVGELTYYSEGRIVALARKAPPRAAESNQRFVDAVQGKRAKRSRVFLDELDVLYLRYNPVEDAGGRMWEQDTGITFGQIAMHQGVLVLNHPYTLVSATNKAYLEQFPEAIRPRSIITRSVEEIQSFHREQNESIVVKPVHGYGGQDVYLLKGEATNLKQIVESLSRSSYIIAQEYLPAGRDGDIRLFLVNGRPLQCEGKYAAVRRVNDSGDFRSNLSAGAKPHKAEITEKLLEIADIVRPRLLADGLFEVGIDIVGDKLVEINVISAGGLNAAGRLEGVDFGAEVIRAIERKVTHKRHYGDRIGNLELAVMD